MYTTMMMERAPSHLPFPLVPVASSDPGSPRSGGAQRERSAFQHV